MYHNSKFSNAFVSGEILGFASESSDATFGVLPGYIMDPEDEFNDLRHKLITLNGQLGRIDGRFDYSGIIRRFDDAPPDQALVVRMRSQVERMQSDLVQFQNPFGPSDNLQAPPFRALPTANQHPFPPASSSPEIRPELGPGPATLVNSGTRAPIVQKSIGKSAPVALERKIRQGSSSPPGRDTLIERDFEDSQVDVCNAWGFSPIEAKVAELMCQKKLWVNVWASPQAAG